MNVRFSPSARRDLLSIRDYIAERNPRAAERIVERVLQSAAHLETFPLMGREGRVASTRELVVPRTKFILVYSLPDAEHVDVERVLHGAQKYP